MQLEISVEELRKRKLFVASPQFGGQNYGMYMKSCLDLQGLCTQYGIEARFSFIFNESLITRARNYLCDEFLRSGFTHLLFIDADIHYDPKDVIALLAMDRDVIGAPYPKKSIKWGSIMEACRRSINYADIIKFFEQRAANSAIAVSNTANANANVTSTVLGDSHIVVTANPHSNMSVLNITPAELMAVTKIGLPVADMEKVGGDYVFNAVAGTGQFQVSEPLEVMEIGTGFMMIKKEVFQKFAAQYPELKYKPDHVGQANFDGTRYIHAYFDTVIDTKKTIIVDGVAKEVGGSDRYLSEDYEFCQWYRNMGGKIYLCPWMKTFHIGTYPFVGDMQAVAQYVGAL